MLDFRGADAECQRPERTVRCGMAVPAHHGHTGQREPLLRADDMDDALFGRVDAYHLNAEFGAIAFEQLKLQRALRVGNRGKPVIGRHIVIGHCQRQVRPPDLPPRDAQSFKRLRSCYFMDQMPVDPDQRRPIRTARDDMIVPDFLIQGAGIWHGRGLASGLAGVKLDQTPGRRSYPRGGSDSRDRTGIRGRRRLV